MNLEIHRPELVQRVRSRIQSGEFHDVDELFMKALDALEEKNSTPNPTAFDDSGAALLKVLQDSPFPEVDLAPVRDRLPAPVRDIVL